VSAAPGFVHWWLDAKFCLHLPSDLVDATVHDSDDICEYLDDVLEFSRTKDVARWHPIILHPHLTNNHLDLLLDESLGVHKQDCYDGAGERIVVYIAMVNLGCLTCSRARSAQQSSLSSRAQLPQSPSSHSNTYGRKSIIESEASTRSLCRASGHAPAAEPVGLAGREVECDGRGKLERVRRCDMLRGIVAHRCSVELRTGDHARVENDRCDLGVLCACDAGSVLGASRGAKQAGRAPIEMNSLRRPSANLLVQ
jgi:hypothetical protein